MAPLFGLGPALPGLAVKGTLLLAAGAALVRAMRQTSAASRHVIWTATFGAILLLPIATAMLPKVLLDVLPPAATSARSEAAGALPERASGGGTRVASAEDAKAPAIIATAASSLKGWSMAPGGMRPAAGRAGWMSVGPVTGWLAGVCVLAISGMVGTLGLRRQRLRARRADDPGLLARVRHVATQLHIRRPVHVLVATDDSTPLTWGVFRPTILLPHTATAWMDGRLDAVLVHELAHVRRLDAVSHLVARVAVTLLWFNPLAWLALKRAKLERERACDDVVLARGTRPSSYAGDLLNLVRSSATPAGSSFVHAMARRTQLEHRLLAILSTSVNRKGASRVSATFAATLIVLTLPVAAVHMAARKVSSETPRPKVGAASQTPEVPRQQSVTALPPTQSNRTGKAPSHGAPALEGSLVTVQEPRENRLPVDFSGVWVPDDPERVQALFEVGRSRYPGSGLTITQDATTLVISVSFEMGRQKERVQRTLVYRLDGTESTNPSILPPIMGAEVSRARWDGDRLLITIRCGDRESEHALSMRDGVLEVAAGQSTFTFRRKKS